MNTEAMPQDEIPVGIHWLLTVRRYTCAEDAYVHARQESMRRHITEIADSHDNGWHVLRQAAIAQLQNDDLGLIDSALAVLFVVGKAEDLQLVERFASHANEHICKAARTCLFELRRRPAGA